MKATSTETCPNCLAALVTDGVTTGWTIICANCRTPFQYQAEQVKTVTSGKAIASLVLGLSSLFAACLTGIPAVILGILALRDIRHSKQDMVGGRLAGTGIATGGLCSVICGPIVLAIALPAVQMMRNPPREYSQLEADQIMALAKKFPAHKLPAGLVPFYGVESPYHRQYQVVFSDGRQFPNTLLLMTRASTLQPMSKDVMERQVQGWAKGRKLTMNVKDTRRLTFDANGTSIEVIRDEATDPASGVRRRQYVSFFDQGKNQFAVMIVTGLNSAEGTATTQTGPVVLTEEEVRAFFESFQLPSRETSTGHNPRVPAI